MPYCTQCGNAIGERNPYCGSCGAPQPGAQASASRPRSSSSGPTGSTRNTGQFPDWNPRTAAILCYIPVLGWIPCLVVLATDRFREDQETRFHAFQGLYLFVAWLLVDWVVGPLMSHSDSMEAVASLMKTVLFIAWIWMMVKVAHREHYKLPFLGDLAEKSVAEQR